METIRRNRHRGDVVSGLELKWRIPAQARRARLSLAPSTSSEPAALLSTLAQAAADEEVGPSQIVAEETADLSDVAANETVALGEAGVRRGRARHGISLFDNIETTHLLVENAISNRVLACGPDPSDIWDFAHRTSNVSRKPDLQDLPESIVITLNDFMLDALSLGNEDLEGYRLNAIRSLRTSFWISLGTSDEEREKKLNYLLEQKTFYCVQIRTCIAEAL
ncbi:unnamed protein product [Cylicocyclus nassatus]|uniref:Uncharacterized protein n=1 Tax=Cylicocyclus nassatus TaxID=53992 RepID=A0AA36GW52_CYLNA|nr:unnamed protein product [Cylicocyclus nassatus]